jgi:hypothetical protein
VDGGVAVITYSRTGGRHSPGQPADHVVLQIDGDRYELEVRSDRASVGRFAGALSAADASQLADLAAAVGGPVEGESRPGAAAVSIAVGDAVARFGQGSAPDAWAALEAELERLAGELADPVAAIGLVVASDGSSAALEHLGTDACAVDTSNLVVHAFLWQGYYEPAGEWTGALAGGAEQAGPGWRLELPFDHGLALGDDTTLQVDVTFGLDGALARVVHAPPIAPPG